TGLLRCGARSNRSITSSTLARERASAVRTPGVHSHCTAKPPCPKRCRPSMRLSSTVPPSNSSMFWKVRAMPSRTTRCRGRRVMSRPWKTTFPDAGSNTRVITFSTDVLPAPFGPMMANTSPSSTSKDSSRTACTPPKRSDRSFTSNTLTSVPSAWPAPGSSISFGLHVRLAALEQIAPVQRESLEEGAHLHPAPVQAARLEQHEQRQDEAEHENLQPELLGNAVGQQRLDVGNKRGQ